MLNTAEDYVALVFKKCTIKLFFPQKCNVIICKILQTDEMDPMKKLMKSLYCERQEKRNLIYSKFGKKLLTLIRLRNILR